MSLSIKVAGETPKSGKSICKTCKHAKHIVGQNCQDITLCHLFAGHGSAKGPVPFRIAECGDYHPVNLPWLHEMYDMAWIVEARKRGPAGFGEAARNPDEMEVVVTKPGEGQQRGRPMVDFD